VRRHANYPVMGGTGLPHGRASICLKVSSGYRLCKVFTLRRIESRAALAPDVSRREPSFGYCAKGC
jgi:hypothetical protein